MDGADETGEWQNEHAIRKHAVPVIMLGLVILVGGLGGKTTSRAKFATPDEAATALQQAFKTEDLEKMQAIFGREGMEAVGLRRPGCRPA